MPPNPTPGQRIGRPRSPTGNTARVLAQLSTSEWRTAAFVAAASAVPAPNVHDRLRALHGFGEVERRSVPWVGYQWRLVAIGRCAFCGDPVALNRRGRPRIYCSSYCKDKASRCRRAA